MLRTNEPSLRPRVPIKQTQTTLTVRMSLRAHYKLWRQKSTHKPVLKLFEYEYKRVRSHRSLNALTSTTARFISELSMPERLRDASSLWDRRTRASRPLVFVLMWERMDRDRDEFTSTSSKKPFLLYAVFELGFEKASILRSLCTTETRIECEYEYHEHARSHTRTT